MRQITVWTPHRRAAVPAGLGYFFRSRDKGVPGLSTGWKTLRDGREAYKNVIDEFFFNVYYRYYTESGITGARLYDPGILDWMGLPPDAGAEDIKKRFRELAKKYHPDTGGNSSDFIRLMENYHKLID